MQKIVLVLCLSFITPALIFAITGVGGAVAPDTSEGEGVLLADADFWIGPPDQSSSMILLVISEGRKVKVTDEYKGYYEVWHRNLIGYVAKEFVRILPAGEEEKKEGAVKVVKRPDRELLKGMTPGLYRITRETSLRTGPDSKARVLLRFRVGDRVKVLDDSGYWWWKVRFDGKTGWAKKALLQRP